MAVPLSITGGIGHFDSDPSPTFVKRGYYPVRVPDDAAKCVAFIGIMERGKFKPRATAFFVSYVHDQHRFMGLVTAEHVISGLLTRGHEVYVRINLANGDVADSAVPNDAWRFYPDERNPSDVAICPIADMATMEDGTVVRFDVMTIALNGPNAIAATPEVIRERDIGIGEEIFIVGLFRSHYGRERNFPVLRIGNIAAMRHEPVQSSYGDRFIDAYLVEARSIGGLSGSPVFVSIPPARITRGELKFEVGKQQFYLLGLVHGHFDIANLNDDAVADDERDATSGIHTGMGVVIPVEKIIETMEHPDFHAERQGITMKKGAEGATPE